MIVLLCLPRLAAAQANTAVVLLGESDVIRLAGMRSPAAAVAGAMHELAEARTRTAGLLPNPALNWGRETVSSGPNSGRGSQDIVTASLPVNVARSLTRRSLVASEGAWMRAEASLSRANGILDSLLAYYEAVLAERHVEILVQAVSNLEEAARVLSRREAAGSASGYESARLAIACELARSHLAEARSSAGSAKARLGVLLGLRPEAMRVTTALPLIAEDGETALAQGHGEARQAMQHARASLRWAVQAEDRADWAWFPTLELAGGMKQANNYLASSGYGYVVGVALDIPVFDHGQAQRDQAAAQRALATARVEALSRSMDADVQSALFTFRAARMELLRFEGQTSDQIEALLTAAQSGYREGERAVIELLDAQRARTEVAEQRLNLLGAAKRAEARLRAAVGDFQ